MLHLVFELRRELDAELDILVADLLCGERGASHRHMADYWASAPVVFRDGSDHSFSFFVFFLFFHRPLA